MLYYEVNLVDATTSFLDFYCIFIKYYLWMKYLPYQICLEWVKNMLDYVFVTVCIYWLWEQQSFEALLWASNCVLSEIPDFFVWGPFINKRWFLSFPFLTKSEMYLQCPDISHGPLALFWSKTTLNTNCVRRIWVDTSACKIG